MPHSMQNIPQIQENLKGKDKLDTLKVLITERKNNELYKNLKEQRQNRQGNTGSLKHISNEHRNQHPDNFKNRFRNFKSNICYRNISQSKRSFSSHRRKNSKGSNIEYVQERESNNYISRVAAKHKSLN